MPVTRWLPRVAVHLVLAGGGLVMMYPLLFSLLASFTSPQDFLSATVLPVPGALYLDNYLTLLHPRLLPIIGAWIVNTLIRIAWFTILPTIVAVLCGYVFARLKFRFKEAAFLILLASMLVPNIVYQVPLFVMMARWPLVGGNDLFGQGGSGFIGQLPALLLPGIVSAYSVFLMRQAFYAIPIDYEEAARIDGANTLQVLAWVYTPMLIPTIMVLVITTFVGVWNDYTWPLMAVGANQEAWPIGLAFQRLMSGGFPLPNVVTAGAQQLTNTPLLLAAATAVTLPTVLAFAFFQRYFLEGLQGAGIKG